jgi:uncharacterized repeat protein (TIGR04052 family)
MQELFMACFSTSRYSKSLLGAASAALALSALLSACGGGGDGGSGNGWSVDASGAVKLQFAAYAGSTPIQCGTAVAGLGSKSSGAQIQDLRFYISNVKLLKADGSSVALTLSGTDNNNYQGADSVSLITLSQTGVGSCTAAASLNKLIQGTVPAGQYVGVTMTLGVPFSLNHLNSTDPATPAVLRSDVNPGMSWNWRGGRKFTKVELQSTDTGSPMTLLHLGSTGCVGDPANGVAISSCTAPNRVPLTFSSFNPNTQAIALDVKALFVSADFSVANSCMSSPTDAKCVGPFGVLALTFNSDGTGTGQPMSGQTQSAFKAVGL